MTEEQQQQEGGFGSQLLHRLQGQGMTKAQIYKVISLQRLSEEVSQMAQAAGLAESVLLEISKVRGAVGQKELAEVVIENKLSLSKTQELSRLIRRAEKDENGRGNKIWDFFFKIKERLVREGASSSAIWDEVEEFRDDIEGRPAPDDVSVLEREDEAGLDARRPRPVNFNKLTMTQGKGLDVGTANIVAAGRSTDGQILHNIQRDHFLDLRDDRFTQRMLAKLGINWTPHNGRLYVIGDPAFELANVFEKEVRRPMKDGMISPHESEALVIVDRLISKLLGKPTAPGEIVAFSIPAAPVDAERDTVYHQGVLESLLRRQGYAPKAVLEGLAVVFSELEDESFSGIGISCGGGMFNVCVSYKSIPAASFATQRGGDWIDSSVSKAVGLTPSQVCAIKESGVNLAKPNGRVEDAITIYYRNLVQYTIEQIRRKLESHDSLPGLEDAVLVCSGGTSMIGGFIDVFRQELERTTFPIRIREVRMARDALNTVSNGCLNIAQQETAAAADRPA